MKCLVTGASSGIGRDMCKYLGELGHEVILVSRNKEKLDLVSSSIKGSRVYLCDLKSDLEVDRLCDFILKEKPEVVINNAGFGAFGFYDEIELKKEMDMIKVNVISLHKITRTCLKYMEGSNYHILNVASSAGFMPGGPILNTYYATKNYVRSYTLGLYEELKNKKSGVNISVLCPGPVNTNFNNVANVKFSLRGLSSEYVAKYSVDKMLKGKRTIIPGFSIKALAFISKFSPTNIVLYMTYKRQKAKEK